MDIFIIVMLIFLNGLFAMSEIALVTAKPTRLKLLAEKGDRAAGRALSLGEKPTRFLSTIQIGITAIGILSGIFGEAALAAPLALWLQDLGLRPAVSSIVATTAVVACITYFSIILGELVPKRMAQQHAEGIARLMARPIYLLSAIAYPFVIFLSFSTDAVLRLFGRKDGDDSDLTEEDIQAMVNEGALVGVIEERERDLVRNVFRLDDRPISSMMTPRNEIVYLDLSDSPESVMEKVVASGKTRFPVCRGGLSSILGVITATRLLTQCMLNDTMNLSERLQPVVYAPETQSGMKLLEQLRESGVHQVFVVDKYGDVAGLVTLQDVLVALAGEFKPRDPDDIWAFQRDKDSWLLDGLIPVPELQDRLGLKSVPEEGKGRYNTLGGMLMWLKGSMPRAGDKIVWEEWTFEVADLDGNRVDKVLASRNGRSGTGVS